MIRKKYRHGLFKVTAELPWRRKIASLNYLLASHVWQQAHEYFPDLKIRVINVVDLMKLESNTQHPHGLSEEEFDSLFTKSKPVIFAFHGYPSLVHRLTYRRSNHENMHVHGYKEEGTITTYFDMTVLNDLDRFHLVLDAIRYLPLLGESGARLTKILQKKLIEHRQYIDQHGQDMPENTKLEMENKWNTDGRLKA